KPLMLHTNKYLPSLGGKRWEEDEDAIFPNNAIGADARLLIKRSKIQASIILRESDDTAKYDLFQRLNTGGSQLSPQEVRNCILVMVNRDFYSWLRELADFKPFRSCIALSDRPVEESYDLELALRFLILVRIRTKEISQI